MAIKFYKGLKANLPVTGTDNQSLYFVEDTTELFKSTGNGLPLAKYSDFIMVTTLPTTNQQQGKVYLETTTWSLNAWNGSAWKVLSGSFTPTSTDTLQNKTIDATQNTITNLRTTNFDPNAISTSIPSSGAVDTKLPTEKAVSDALNVIGTKINSDIKDVSYNATTQVWTFTKQDNSTIQINHILDSLIKQVSYDSTAKKLIFTFDGDPTPAPVEISVTDLVDVYTVGDTDSVDLTMTGNNITADVKLSNTAGNLLTVEAGKGLYATLEWIPF